MKWFFLVLFVGLVGIIGHGLLRGEVFVKHGPPIPRATSPKTYWFLIAVYTLTAVAIARWAAFEFFKN
jgi:hypothetical protein